MTAFALLAVVLAALGGLAVAWRRERAGRQRLAAEIEDGRGRVIEAEERALVATEALRGLVEGSRDAILVIDDAGTIVFHTERLGALLDDVALSCVGTPAGELLVPPEGEQVHDLATALLTGHVEWSVGPQRVPVEAAVTDLRHLPEVGGLLVQLRDVSDRKRLEASLRRQALHDPLTGLLNRAGFEQSLHAAVARVQDMGTGVAVLYLDCDGFKLINDEHGHEAGDRLLVAVGNRLAGAVRGDDFVARLGGDEFAAVLVGVVDEPSADAARARIEMALERPVDVGPVTLTPRASVGLAFAPGEGADAEELLRRADAAMYARKRARKAGRPAATAA